MPRLVPSGTPSRTNRYVYPRRKLRFYGVSIAVALGAAILLAAGVLHGTRTMASPGPLSTVHAPVERTCANCHSPQVADPRCERCHDPFGTTQYQNAGHVWFGTKDPARVEKAAAVECARCHTDHRGRAFPIRRVDDRDCVTCHFPVARHPEFALVKAAVMKDEGLSFSHKKHLKAVRKARLEDCQSCHEPTADRSGFLAPNFDRHCAQCHLKAGTLGPTDPIPAAAVDLPQNIDAPWAKARARVEADGQGRVVVPKLAHKDPWVLFNLRKIERQADPDGFAKIRAALQTKIAELTARLDEHPAAGLARAALESEEKRLSGELAGLSDDSRAAYQRRKALRALARVRAEIELGPLPMAAPRPRRTRQLAAELAAARAELAEDDRAQSASAGLPPAQRADRLAAVGPLTAACALCHVFDGAVQQPVKAGVPVLGRANYSHRPHLQQVACAACHGAVEESKKSQDVILPRMATCSGCHRPGNSRSDCAECHRYHPPTEPWPPI